MTATLSLAGEPLPVFEAPPHNPAGPSPLRKPGSVRRTSSIDATWPEGQAGVLRLEGHARDIFTPLIGDKPQILAEDRMDALADNRVIRMVTSEPPRVALLQLAGARAGGHLRAALEQTLPAERAAGTPLYLLLDDLAGTSLIAEWAWSQWGDDVADPRPDAEIAERMSKMAGVCIGFRPGSGALQIDDGDPRTRHNVSIVPPLPHPDDPAGWHELVDRGGVNLRRARRVDIWREGEVLHIDSGFQDTASTPAGHRVAIHEYRLTATADAASGVLLSVAADPRTLPYRECPAATVNIGALIGSSLIDLRNKVPVVLGKTAGCTHLNDALRALSEVPVLAKVLA